MLTPGHQHRDRQTRMKIEDLGPSALQTNDTAKVTGGTAATSGQTGLRVQVATATQRQTPKTDFGTVLGRGVASPFIPGGSVLGAAIGNLTTLTA